MRMHSMKIIQYVLKNVACAEKAYTYVFIKVLKIIISNNFKKFPFFSDY